MIGKFKRATMGKQSPTFEWQVAANEQEWAQLSQSPVLSTQGPRDKPYWLVELLLMMLVIGSVGGLYWYTTAAERQQVTTALTIVVQQEARAEQVLPAPAGAEFSQVAVVPAIAGMHREATLRLLNLQGDQVVVTVITSTATNTPAYRQTQFYRRTAAGWERIAPNAALWGAPQELETPSFRWRYQENDAQVVATVAPQLEALYTTVRHNFGLAHVPSSKLTLEVKVTQPPGYSSPSFDTAEAYVVSSPALYWAPMNLTDAELLAQSLALPLLNTIIPWESEQHRLHLSWQPLLSGLRLWQLWELKLPLYPWHQEVIAWLYGGLARANVEQRIVLPAHYTELCTVHRLWLSSPLQIGLPFACNESDQSATYFIHTSGPSLLHLTYSGTPTLGGYVEPLIHGVSERGQIVAMAMFIEYAVATYGRDRLPFLVKNLQQYDSWDTLLSAVYGVSAAEFEAGWHDYLVDHYGG